VGKPAPKEGVTAPAPEAAKPPRKPQGGAAAGGAAGQKGGAAAPGASAAQGGGEAAGGASAQATPKKLTAGSGIREDRPRKGQVGKIFSFFSASAFRFSFSPLFFLII